MAMRKALRFIGQPVTISMVRLGEWTEGEAANYPIITLGTLSLGELMYHNARRRPSDPMWTVETIGL